MSKYKVYSSLLKGNDMVSVEKGLAYALKKLELAHPEGLEIRSYAVCSKIEDYKILNKYSVSIIYELIKPTVTKYDTIDQAVAYCGPGHVSDAKLKAIARIEKKHDNFEVVNCDVLYKVSNTKNQSDKGHPYQISMLYKYTEPQPENPQKGQEASGTS